MVLELNFLEALIQGSTQEAVMLLKPDNCKFMLQDMARSSPLMGLDNNSMNRIWSLVTIIYKWQMYLTHYPHHLLDVSFRHLESIKSLYSTINNSDLELVLATKERLLKFWNSLSDINQISTYTTVNNWLSLITGKVSLLVRLGFQSAVDGSFLVNGKQQYFSEFRDNIGENIYSKCAQLFQQSNVEPQSNTLPLGIQGKCIQQLEDMLHLKNSEISQNKIGLYHLKFNFTNESNTDNLEEDERVFPNSTYNKSVLQNYF